MPPARSHSGLLWMIALVPLLLGLVTSAFGAVYGLVETVDGKSWVGEVTFESGALSIQATNGATQRASLETLSRFQPRERPKIIPPAHGLRATYYNSKQLEGWNFSRLDPVIDFDWAEGSPAKEIVGDNFSARWLGQLEAPATGDYTLVVEANDGVRLWVDNKQLIDQWHDQSRTEHEAMIALEAGHKYDVKLEFYENGGTAVARLLWIEPGQTKTVIPEARLFAPPPAAATASANPAGSPSGTNGLIGLYFSTQDHSGSFVTVTNPNINFQWNDQPPLPGIPKDHFSVRWVGQIIPTNTAPYTFYAESDDGMRLWVDRDLLLKAWNDGVFNLTSQPVTLEKGRAYSLRFEMFDAASSAMARLSWSSPSLPRTVISPQFLSPGPLPSANTPVEINQPAGVLLTGGTFIARRIHDADSSQVRFSSSSSAPTLSTIHVARINFHRLSPDKAATLQSGRTGLLLQSGDFVDGEIRAIREDRVQVHSILFGLKRFGMDNALSAVLRDAQTNAAPFEVRTRDQSVFFVQQPRLEQNSLRFLDPALTSFKIPSEDVVDFRRTPKEAGQGK